MTGSPVKPTKPRPVGTRAGLDLQKIIQVSRSLPPDKLSMQAVADRLGVDRSALNHYVVNRATLLEQVAGASFKESFSAVDIAASGSWDTACRIYARGFVEAVVSTGPLVDHLKVDFQTTKALETTEALLQSFLDGGFTDELAVRFLVIISNVCMAHARDRLAIEGGKEPTRAALTQTALAARNRADYPNLDRVTRHPFETYGERQLETAIEAIVDGARAALNRLHEENVR